MTRFKYIKHGIKRKHNIIEEILPHLEQLTKIDGIKKIIPARIYYSPSRKIDGLRIKVQREVKSGFKLLIHNKGAIQEVFIVIEGSKKDEIKRKLQEYTKNI